MDYYSALGLNEQASSDEIKSAYKKLAMKYHPDRGGDESKFKEINEAYTTLSDPDKKAHYDNRNNPQFGVHHGGPFHQHFGFDPFGGMPPDFQDIMGNFGFTFRSNNVPQKNRDLNLRCRISLKDSYLGKELDVSFKLPNGEDQNINVRIPPGVEHGQTLKVAGQGDNQFPNLRRGDLIIIIEIDKDPRFYKEELNLVTSIDVDIFEAMIGCTKTVKNIDDNEIEISIRPGTQHGQKYSCANLGFKHPRYNNVKGSLITVVNIKTPIVKDPALIEKIKKLSAEIKGST
jgi:curved DNA-binding protein